MEPPRLQRTPSMEQRELFKKYDSHVFDTKPTVVETGPLDAKLLKRKRQNQKKRFSTPKKIIVTEEHINPAEILYSNRRPGITRRGGKRKRHKTRKRKRKRKRRKHFKGGLFEKPGVGIKVGQTVRIKTENSTDDTKTWDPCWKVSLMMNRAAQVEKHPVYDKEVRYENIKPQGFLSKRKCQNISGGKRRKTHRRKKHRRRRKRKTYKK